MRMISLEGRGLTEDRKTASTHHSVRFRSREGFASLALPISPPARTTESLHSYALPIIAFGVIVAVLFFGRVFFMTALAAIIIAFILDPFVALLIRINFPRSVSSLVVCVGAALIVSLAGLGAYSQFASLLDAMPSLSQRIGAVEDAGQQQLA